MLEDTRDRAAQGAWGLIGLLDEAPYVRIVFLIADRILLYQTMSMRFMFGTGMGSNYLSMSGWIFTIVYQMVFLFVVTLYTNAPQPYLYLYMTIYPIVVFFRVVVHKVSEWFKDPGKVEYSQSSGFSVLYVLDDILSFGIFRSPFLDVVSEPLVYGAVGYALLSYDIVGLGAFFVCGGITTSLSSMLSWNALQKQQQALRDVRILSEVFSGKGVQTKQSHRIIRPEKGITRQRGCSIGREDSVTAGTSHPMTKDRISEKYADEIQDILQQKSNSRMSEERKD